MKIMKNLRDGTAAAVVGFFVGASVLRGADTTNRYQAQAGASKVLVQGTSSLHDWEMKGKILGGFVEFAGPVDFDTNQAALTALKDGVLPATAQAIIPVRSIKSEAEVKPEYMEGLMQEAMKEKNFSRIEYRVTELKLKLPHAKGAAFEFDAKGDLAIAGVTNQVSFPVTITPVGADKIMISGEAKLKMTAFKVPPPAPDFGMGLMKCGDDIKIVFDWVLAKAKAQP